MVSGTSSYACKKWGLFAFTLVAVISNLAITTLESLAIKDLDEDDLGIDSRSGLTLNLKNSSFNPVSKFNGTKFISPRNTTGEKTDLEIAKVRE